MEKSNISPGAIFALPLCPSLILMRCGLSGTLKEERRYITKHPGKTLNFLAESSSSMNPGMCGAALAFRLSILGTAGVSVSILGGQSQKPEFTAHPPLGRVRLLSKKEDIRKMWSGSCKYGPERDLGWAQCSNKYLSSH